MPGCALAGPLGNASCRRVWFLAVGWFEPPEESVEGRIELAVGRCRGWNAAPNQAARSWWMLFEPFGAYLLVEEKENTTRKHA